MTGVLREPLLPSLGKAAKERLPSIEKHRRVDTSKGRAYAPVRQSGGVAKW
ncbi:MAG: hypothetical protein ABI674_06875 [Spartobacteria bacterium]